MTKGFFLFFFFCRIVQRKQFLDLKSKKLQIDTLGTLEITRAKLSLNRPTQKRNQIKSNGNLTKNFSVPIIKIEAIGCYKVLRENICEFRILCIGKQSFSSKHKIKTREYSLARNMTCGRILSKDLLNM
jgi:hypothetical protein